MAADREPDALAEQPDLVERDDAGRIGDAANPPRRLQLDEGNPPSCRPIDDLHTERRCLTRSQRNGDQQGKNAEVLRVHGNPFYHDARRQR